ncbi:MAG: hypothetical protein LBS86_05335 [Treponema sp.]|nr:hypothetical protein [Treponema sp.]
MSLVYTSTTLENPADATIASRGLIEESEVRRLTLKALEDCNPASPDCLGALTLVISERIRAALPIMK